MSTQREAILQREVTHYLRSAYPGVIFRSDFASGLFMSKGKGFIHQQLQSGRAWPDLFIYEPRNGKHGLAIELKAEGVSVLLKNGDLPSNPHIREQAEVLRQLRDRGYAAEFAVGYAQARELIDAYLA